MKMYLSQCKTVSEPKYNLSKFTEFIERVEIEELCKMVADVLNSSEAIIILDNILQGFYELNKYNDKKQKLIRTVFDALRKINASNKHVNEIINRVVADFLQLDKAELVKFVDYFIERLKNNDDDFMSWKDLLPLLLEKLEEQKCIHYKGSDISGQEYKTIIIHLICDIDWDIKIISSIAKMFVDLIVDINDTSISKMIMKTLTIKLVLIDFKELPPLIHQLLKLGYDHNSILLFSTLSKYFTNNYASICNDTDSEETCDTIISNKISFKELEEVESTVLYYIYESVLDNMKGSMEYIRYLKSVINAPEYILDTFVISVLLLISDLYEDETLQILKLAFIQHIQDKENLSSNAWIRKIFSTKVCAFKVMDQIIEKSNKDRQLIFKSMVDFAFILLNIERKVGNENHPFWDYGSKILQKIAKKRHDAAGTILELLVDKIVQGGLNTIQYTDCLASMCRKLTATILEHQIWINILLEHLLVIKDSTATQLLKAILPLIRVSCAIRDNLIMILRKALYRKGVQTRQMSVIGFTQLLKNLKLSTLTALSQSESLASSNVASSSSIFTQAIVEKSTQKLSCNPWHNTSLCREILAILSKCFTHEIEVRSHLYAELYYSILKNEELIEYAVEMLLEHFFKYYIKDEEIIPPIIFDKCCINQGINVILLEPLYDLIFVLQKIYLKGASKDSSKIDKLANVLESLCKRMGQMELEHMEVDETIDLFDNNPKIQQKLLNIKIAISVYESLLAYKIGSWSHSSVNIGQSIINLFKGYSRLVENLKKHGKSKKGGGKNKKNKSKDANEITIKKFGRANNFKLLKSVMDFDTISKSIVLLYNQSNSWATQNQTSGIRGRVEFHIYILQTCLQLLQNVKILKDNELKEYLSLNKQNITIIGKTLYKFIISDLKSIRTFNEQVVGLGTECFKECCEIMCILNSSGLSSFVEAICGVDFTKGLSYQLQELILSLKEIFVTTLNEEIADEMLTQKLALNLIEIIYKFVQKLNFSEADLHKNFTWLNRIAEIQENIDIQVASIISQLIFFIEEQCVEFGEIIQDFCVEIYSILGRVDKTEPTATRKYRMINEKNVQAIYIIINKTLSLKLQSVNWLFCRLKAECIALSTFESDSESNQQTIKDREQTICRQFSFILGVFELLANVKIVPGQASDIIFKNLQKIYNFACSLAKYFRKKSTQTNPAFQSVKFIPVIQGAGNALKQAVTELISHIESSQSGGKSNDANIQRNKILKEVMVIPGVVQAMDMFDKEIALLSRKTKIDLMKYIKYGTVRDFRIQNSQLIHSLEKMNVSLIITQNYDNSNKDNITDNDSDTNDESPTKKQCI